MSKIDIRAGLALGALSGLICFIVSVALQNSFCGILASLMFLVGWLVCSIMKNCEHW